MSKNVKAEEVKDVEVIDDVRVVDDAVNEEEKSESKLEKFWGKIKKPISYVGAAALGFIAAMALANRNDDCDVYHIEAEDDSEDDSEDETEE